MDMFAALAFTLCLIPQHRQGPIHTGWTDELNQGALWAPLGMENKAASLSLKEGELFLVLGRVPADWPYPYQWSGVSRDASIDIARFPVLMARTTFVKGYVHLDIDVLDAKGKALKTLRSSILTAAGISMIDLGKDLDPAIYSLRIRMIVGGPNDGCAAAYDWVRFVRREDAEFLTQHPEFNNVIPDLIWGKR